jgi:predicted glutamine amidotransferase
MCELVGLSSNAPTTVNISLPKLAEHGRISGTYNDGWGVGYYEGPDVRLMKDSSAVADSDWIKFISNHNLRSLLVIAHTRKATRGARSYPNAQPFVRELAGRAHLFAHNGDLPGIFESRTFQSVRFNPIGETDSERAFCVLLDQMTSIWKAPHATPLLRDRFLIVSAFAEELRALGPQTFYIRMVTFSLLTDIGASMPTPAGSKHRVSCCFNVSAKWTSENFCRVGFLSVANTSSLRCLQACLSQMSDGTLSQKES